MNRLRVFALALVALGWPCTSPGQTASQPGKEAIEQARAAYRQAGAFREVFEFVLELPDGRREPRRQEYGVARDGTAFLVLSSKEQENLRIVARDGRMVGTAFNADERYAEVPYAGDFADALRRMGGAQSQLAAPPAVVARQGGDFAAFLEALRLGILAPLEVTGAQPGRAADGSAVLEVELKAANGRLTVGLDPVSHRLTEMHIAMGEGAQQVRASGEVRFHPEEGGTAPAWPDLAGRTAVATLEDLQSGNHPLGEPAPAVALRRLDGGTVRLADFRGSVVVLDFWATWCVPCWTALQHTGELAAWAASWGLPVKVFAVDTLEKASTFEEQSRLAGGFLQSRKLELPVLLDVGNEMFKGFRSPGLPSLLILDREGKLARYHSGLLQDMTATVKSEVLEILKPGK